MEVLLRPIISEKLTRLSDKLNQYGFVVHQQANKLQIRDEVKRIYGVEVEKVRTVRVPAREVLKNTKSGVVRGRKSGYKKAIVTVAQGDVIDFYKNV